jgi:MtN3 and saliva related transmembrane protein
MDRLEFLGFVAGFLSMIAFAPQVYKTYKTKSAEGISIQTFIIYATSTILWTIYGFIFNKPAIYITNIVVLVVSSTQIILKIKYDRADRLAQKQGGCK